MKAVFDDKCASFMCDAYGKPIMEDNMRYLKHLEAHYNTLLGLGLIVRISDICSDLGIKQTDDYIFDLKFKDSVEFNPVIDGNRILLDFNIDIPEVDELLYRIARISPKHGNDLMDILGNEMYNEIIRKGNNNGR